LIGEKESQRRQLRSNGDQLTIVDPDGYERSFSAAWPVAEITREQPVLASAWEVGGKVNFGFDSDQGNDDETTFNLSGNLNINDEWNKNSFRWDVEIENDTGTKTKEWQLGYSYSRYFTENWFVQGAINQQYDSSEDLRSEIDAGGSLGYRFKETAKETLITTAGVTHLWEDYRTEDNQQNIALTAGVSYRKVLIDKLEYYIESKAFYRLGSNARWRFDGEQGFRIGLSDNLSLNLTHYLDYDGTPTDGNQKTDSQIKMGVGYSW
jgi:putative salt-induced outer membrane protein YdiY